ncbi:MAG: methyltransferase [bacterium]|nr:methyltransferase [bacterium]
MRIISGEWRSRKLEVPPGVRTRPMLDRVRAAVFDTLGSYYGTPGRLPPLVAADVFAGGGTLGLEALSRGAASSVFVESDTRALEVLRRNLEQLGVGVAGAVEAGDAWAPNLVDVLAQYRCSLILLDPPYRAAREDGKIAGFLRQLSALADAVENVLLVLHHPAKVSYTADDLGTWDIHAVRRYGTTGITFLESNVTCSPDAPDAEPG